MGEQNQYTAQNLRESADDIEKYDGQDDEVIASMLRFSADSVERLENVKAICNRIISTKKGKYGIVSYMTLCGLAEEILRAAEGNDVKQK